MNNPIFYSDIDGREVGVSIVGNTITFSSTTYVDGVDAAAKVVLYNAAFKAFEKANPGMKTSDGKWNVEIKMNFVDASTVKDHVVAAQGMASENYMNIKNPSNGDARAHSGMGLSGDISIQKDIDPTGNNGKGLLLGTSTASGRFAQMYSQDGGETAVHEEFHNWGLGDYYADVVYDTKTYINGELTQETSGKDKSKGASTGYVGYEGTVMGGTGKNKGLKLHQNNIDDLVSGALKTQSKTAGTPANFVMAIKVDEGRPNGNKRFDQVPQTQTSTTGRGRVKTVSTNPQYKNAGN
jgi:hypothetical protein